jgi:hypothetical protein
MLQVAQVAVCSQMNQNTYIQCGPKAECVNVKSTGASSNKQFRVQRLVADRRVLGELLIKGHGLLLPGGLPGSSGYLGQEVFMAVSGRACRNHRRKHL